MIDLLARALARCQAAGGCGDGLARRIPAQRIRLGDTAAAWSAPACRRQFQSCARTANASAATRLPANRNRAASGIEGIAPRRAAGSTGRRDDRMSPGKGRRVDLESRSSKFPLPETSTTRSNRGEQDRPEPRLGRRSPNARGRCTEIRFCRGGGFSATPKILIGAKSNQWAVLRVYSATFRCPVIRVDAPDDSC